MNGMKIIGKVIKEQRRILSTQKPDLLYTYVYIYRYTGINHAHSFGDGSFVSRPLKKELMVLSQNKVLF